MKSVRLVAINKPLEEQDIPLPPVGDGDLLVRVKAAGICRSDVHYRAGTSPVRNLPVTLGHEVAGVVEQVGSQVGGVQVGDRVCLHYLVTCGHCSYCITGAEQFCVSGRDDRQTPRRRLCRVSSPFRRAMPFPCRPRSPLSRGRS